MSVKVKLIGALRHDAGAERILVLHRSGLSLKDVIDEITAGKPALKRSLVNSQLGDQGLNALVLVNSMEMSVLDGLGTKLKDGDEVVFVPVVHGG